MKLNAQLVTLSACQTGIGKITKGEGMIGLSRALLYAGADNIMVSLWKVSDISTQYYMTYFYHNFMQGATTHTMAYDAQTAKLTMINSSFSRPYYWSAFILIGN
jgi:CHAT domain-containing protein